MRKCGCKSKAGFSLAEAMLAVVVLGIAVAGVLLPFTSSAVVRAEGMRRTLAAKLAGDLIEVIINTPWEDKVNDYDGYSEDQGEIVDGLGEDGGGTVFTDPMYANFSRDATCEYVYVPQESQVGEPKFIRATVRVYYNGVQMTSISRLITE